MQLPLINVNSMTRQQIPGRLGGRVGGPVGYTMSGIGPSDIGEVKQAAALFVQRGDAGPPGGLGPDKNITCTSLSIRFEFFSCLHDCRVVFVLTLCEKWL